MTTKELNKLLHMAVSWGDLNPLKTYVEITWWKNVFRPLDIEDCDREKSKYIMVFGDTPCNTWGSSSNGNVIPTGFWVYEDAVCSDQVVHRPLTISQIMDNEFALEFDEVGFMFSNTPQNYWVNINPFRTCIYKNRDKETILALYVDDGGDAIRHPFSEMKPEYIKIIDDSPATSYFGMPSDEPSMPTISDDTPNSKNDEIRHTLKKVTNAFSKYDKMHKALKNVKDAFETNIIYAPTAHPSYEMVEKVRKVYKTVLDALSLPEEPLPSTSFDGDAKVMMENQQHQEDNKFLEKLKLRDKLASTANAIQSNAFLLDSGEAVINECREYYAIDRAATLEWINELYFNNLCEPYILAGLLQILAAITQKEDEKTMLPIVLIGLRSGQCNEEEAAIAVLEKWRTHSCEDALIMSKDNLHSDWNREYAKSVLTEFEHEHLEKELRNENKKVF